jgi:hypothetical protein
MSAEPASPAVLVWWAWLVAASALNIAVWLRLFLAARRDPSRDATRAGDRAQLALSAGFVFGCAFRSLLPRADVQRICLVDTWLSSVLVGRSVATVAELCFMAQVALTLRALARALDARTVERIALALLPLIAVAEVCSWYAVVTTNYLGNACEQSLWTLSGVLAFACLWILAGRARDDRTRRFAIAGAIFAAGYVAFMATVDVPMYLRRYLADERAGRAYLGAADGLRNLATRWTVTFSWSEWREELAWMGLYFSAAVWVSLAMARAQRWPARPLSEELRSRLAPGPAE